mmetsp:Transcript_15220/g.32576  ORF Transcript_15220/g.32576 Transcript_15220/m.32576 type:complete len:133 (-) Transcript_15220:72-470(-)
MNSQNITYIKLAKDQVGRKLTRWERWLVHERINFVLAVTWLAIPEPRKHYFMTCIPKEVILDREDGKASSSIGIVYLVELVGKTGLVVHEQPKHYLYKAGKRPSWTQADKVGAMARSRKNQLCLGSHLACNP